MSEDNHEEDYCIWDYFDELLNPVWMNLLESLKNEKNPYKREALKEVRQMLLDNVGEEEFFRMEVSVDFAWPVDRGKPIIGTTIHSPAVNLKGERRESTEDHD